METNSERLSEPAWRYRGEEVAVDVVDERLQEGRFQDRSTTK